MLDDSEPRIVSFNDFVLARQVFEWRDEKMCHEPRIFGGRKISDSLVESVAPDNAFRISCNGIVRIASLIVKRITDFLVRARTHGRIVVLLEIQSPSFRELLYLACTLDGICGS